MVQYQVMTPVLFGRIIDALAGAQAKGASAAWSGIAGLVVAWVAFGLFLENAR